MLSSSESTAEFGTKRELVADLLAELRRQATASSDPRPVELIETPLSWVLLGPDVYKLKKPVLLPFVDFTRFEDREVACRAEVRLNRRLAPRTYLGVVPVRKSAGRYTFGTGGPIVEWAVRMRRLDPADRADVRLAKGLLTPSDVDLIAHGLAAFHADAPGGRKAAAFGSPEMVLRNVTDNFVALRASAEEAAPLLDDIERWQLAFIRAQGSRLERRMVEGFIRDGHGDLRLEHVFLHDHDFEVIDGIEFDERYRFGDVCADVAFFAMDLARLGRVDLAERFIATYAQETNDFDLYGVLDFYESYRACVRAKVVLPRLPEEARRYLLLAQSARRKFALPPSLIVVAGSIASGKSTVAERLAEELSAPIVDADRTRKHMLGLGATEHCSTTPWAGAYAKGFTEKVYAEVLRRAGVVLASGRSVVVDASFRSQEARASVRALAAEHRVPFRLFECVAPIEVCRARLEKRDRAKSVSDATPDILEAFVVGFEPITELPDAEHVRLDTRGEVEDALAHARRIIATWPKGLTR